jgi:hypothetical protein
MCVADAARACHSYLAALVSYRLGLVRPARFVRPVAMAVGIAVLGGCASLPSNDFGPSAGSTQGVTGGSRDASTEGSAPATSCHPGSVETFVAPAYRHATSAGQGVCDPTAIADYYASCLASGASKSTCEGFSDSRPHSECAACITTVEAAPAYGPLILVDGFFQANVAGCIELEDPTDRLCAMAQQALSDCELAACAVNCPVTDQASFAAYQACAAQADGAGCQAYYATAQCLSAEVDAGDAGPERACLAPDFRTFYNAIVPLFCGVVQSDGGGPGVDADVSDAPSDAGATMDTAPNDAGSGDGEAEAPASGDASDLHDAAAPEAGNDGVGPDGGLRDALSPDVALDANGQ